jgi:multidrug efflux pump subunit AcrB
MSGLNLSGWALNHRSFVIYCMIAVTVAGLTSYFRLGRSEDPNFTFRTMVVQAAWPGASLDDTLQQVTERIERKLQETKGLDFLRSYTSAGVTTIFVNLQGETTAAQVPDIWYQVRKNVGDIRHTLPAGVVGPGFNDDFGDTYGIIYGFTADGFSHRELRDYVETIRSRLLNVPDVSKIDVLGAQDEQIFVEFSTQQLAGLGIDRSALIAVLQAQNAVSPAGVIQTGNEKLTLRVSGAFESEQDILAINFLSNGRLIRLRDIAEIRHSYADPPQPMSRVNGQSAIGLAIAMRPGGDILALGRNVARAINELTADLPVGIESVLVADQPVVVKTAINDFMTSLWQAIAIIMAVSLVSLGLRAGAVVALSIPLTLAMVFPIMEMASIDLQRISLGALIIALGLLVDDAMTTVDVMTSRLVAGDDKDQAATFAYSTLAFPMLTGSFVSAAGFVPIGLARNAAGEYTFFDLRRRFHRPDCLLVRRRSLCAIARRGVPGQTESHGFGGGRGGLTHLPQASCRRHAGAVVHHWGEFGLSCRGSSGGAPCAAAIFPGFRSSGTRGRPHFAAECLDLCQRGSGDPLRRHPQGGSRHRELEHVCRTRGHSLLPAAQRSTGK